MPALVAAVPQYGWSNITTTTDGAQTPTATDDGAWEVTGTADPSATAAAVLSANSSSSSGPSTFENIVGPPFGRAGLALDSIGRFLGIRRHI